MLNLKKLSITVSLLSVGALSVALFSTGCDKDSTLTPGTGGAGGGKAAAGGAAGSAAGGSAAGGASSEGGAGGTTSEGGAGGTSSEGGAGGTSSEGGAGGTSSAGGAGGSTIVTYNVAMTGAMEVLPTGTTPSTASGQANITLNTATGAVTVDGSFSGLTSAATASHIHGPAAAGAVANPIVVLVATAATSGTVTGSGTLTPDQVTAMLGGMTYINVHTSGYSGGEIRAQIK